MIYAKAEIQNGEMILTEQKEIYQSKLTSDCWLIQFSGLEECETCEFKNTDECGGGETLKTSTP